MKNICPIRHNTDMSLLVSSPETNRNRFRKLVYFLLLACIPVVLHAQKEASVKHDPGSKTIEISSPDRTIGLAIDYSSGCKVARLDIKGGNTLSASGAYTGFRTRGGGFTSSTTTNTVQVEETENGITLSNITYGNIALDVNESWQFNVSGEKITWKIDRTYSNAGKLEESSFPQWNFTDLSLWKGGIIDNGGVIWCKYLSSVNTTYGVHTGSVTFWNPETGNALRISAQANPENHLATKYSQSEKNEFTSTLSVTDSELEPRYNLNRFVHQQADVFAPFDVRKGTVSVTLELQYVDYPEAYSRGNLPGIDAEAVRELLNTTGRYGVVDNGIIGANGWTTNWKCLHESFFAQIGMALNDGNYTTNMAATLDRERDYALLEDGRMLSRWHNADEDQIPGTFNYKTGYYEARWGYTIDSQTGYIINSAEQFDLSGDTLWLRSHKASCEKVLDWLIRRDSNNNGIFEMMNNSIAEQTASDWLDIVWASFENAFVNAQMYEALTLWAECEKVLGDSEKSDYYATVASRLKTAFNKSTGEGGFWSEEKKQYVYWRDKDGSVHGDNLVTPVNFAVIAYGLCDQKDRIALILDEIEQRTSAENLFHWPLCFDSFKREEVSEGNWPFPRYENGDIFPTWGYMGVRAYAGYNKHIALKYIRNILEQYKKDGLSFQRYCRTTQQGLGSDILAGICTSVTALYRDIYGIRPKWNRMGIEPHMTDLLNGTEFTYTLRGIPYKLTLSVDSYSMQTDGFTVKSKKGFGASQTGKTITFYPGNRESATLVIHSKNQHPVNIEINDWEENMFSWTMHSAGTYQFRLTGFLPGETFRISGNNKQQRIKAGKDGTISFAGQRVHPATYRIEKM